MNLNKKKINYNPIKPFLTNLYFLKKMYEQ